MYWPRSRGDTRSPMVAIAPVSKPPAPRPCSARNAMSWSIECARPDSAEPIRKMTIAVMSQRLRPYRSPSLPYNGVVTDDPGQRGGDDQLVQHGQHDREQQAGQDDKHLPLHTGSVGSTVRCRSGF